MILKRLKCTAKPPTKTDIKRILYNTLDSLWFFSHPCISFNILHRPFSHGFTAHQLLSQPQYIYAVNIKSPSPLQQQQQT